MEGVLRDYDEKSITGLNFIVTGLSYYLKSAEFSPNITMTFVGRNGHPPTPLSAGPSHPFAPENSLSE